ncbi:hypothetical protein EGR52_04630 [bacterium]|nr:hypothetical protein [bacterium]
MASFYVYKTNDASETYENKETKEVNNNMLSMMLETSAGSGEYQKTSASAWPTEGYAFNEILSKCEQGSSLSWDSAKNTVIMKGNVTDKCYVYFDKVITLAGYIKSQYTGTQGENNLYLHDSSLTNGAGDNSYRYAGSSETTNNFVCFGYDSTDGTCPTDYLYRIIGVFDNKVKLIKYDYAIATLLGVDGDYSKTYQNYCPNTCGANKGSNTLSEIGAYYWNRNGINTWSESQLNTVNLNKNYINNIRTKWSEKISVHAWKVGGNTYDNISEQTAPIVYQNEINSPTTNKTVNAKIGLMYASDYGYAASFGSWSTTLVNYYNVITNNWMYMGLVEWTLAPQTENSNFACRVYYHGSMGYDVVNLDRAVRPVFYLNSNVTYVSGSGTISSPILLS